jgi:hypothetical protein
MKTLILAAAALVSCSAHAQHSATVYIDGDWYLQAGYVQNRATVDLTSVTYSLGTPADGVAVWEDYLAGGTAGDRLAPSPQHYSTQSWATSIHTGQLWYFQGLDIDVSYASGVDSANLDFVGQSLRNATVTLGWADGFTRSYDLNETSWAVSQTLGLDPTIPPIPEPGTSGMLLAGCGLIGYLTRRKSHV